MTARKCPDELLLRTALTEPNAAKARQQYLKACGIEDLDDQAVYQLFEDLVLDAIRFNEPAVELRRELAEAVLLLLKNGIRRSRGGQRRDRLRELRKRTLVSIGRETKAECIARGMNATAAHFEGAEIAADEGRNHGIRLKPEYLAREMYKRNISHH